MYRIGQEAPVGPASDLQDVDTPSLRLRRIAPVGPASKALKAGFLVLGGQGLLQMNIRL